MSIIAIFGVPCRKPISKVYSEKWSTEVDLPKIKQEFIIDMTNKMYEI